MRDRRIRVRLFCAIAACVTACVPTAIACRYTVRDFAFIELTEPPYRLVRVGEGEDTGIDALLDRANVVYERISSAEPDPALSLTAGDGLVLMNEEDDGITVESVQEAVQSTLRDELQESAFVDFATLLVLIGNDPARAEQANAAAAEGIEMLMSIQHELPRELAGMPRIREIDLSERRAERVALWSLGVDDLGEDESAIVVVYARMKRAGEPIVWDAESGFDEVDVLRQLVTVGQSCECETARDWFNEPVLPHVWNDQRRAQAAEQLGFNPASPMVRAEAIRILERGTFATDEEKKFRGEDDATSLLFGYSEVEIGAPVQVGEAKDQRIDEERDEIERVVRAATAIAEGESTVEGTGAVADESDRPRIGVTRGMVDDAGVQESKAVGDGKPSIATLVAVLGGLLAVVIGGVAILLGMKRGAM